MSLKDVDMKLDVNYCEKKYFYIKQKYDASIPKKFYDTIFNLDVKLLIIRILK